MILCQVSALYTLQCNLGVCEALRLSECLIFPHFSSFFILYTFSSCCFALFIVLCIFVKIVVIALKCSYFLD